MNHPSRPALLFIPTLLCLGCTRPDAASSSSLVERLDGSTITAEALTAGIDSLTVNENVHGLTVSIFNAGRVVYSRAFGSADPTTGRPLTTATEMYGASLSKPVFGVLVMKLVQQGLLDLDTPLQDYFDAPFASRHGDEWHEDLSDLAQDPRYRTITARMALTHTTGLPNWRNPTLEFLYDPGARYSYSGEGMVFLQLAIERLTGRPLESLMEEYIFRPYGMSQSSYQWQPRFEADYAVGHASDGAPLPKDKDNAPRAPSTLETTTDDLVLFLEAVLQGDGLSAGHWNEMFTPHVRIRSRTQFGPGALEETSANDDIELSYGLGWGLLRTPQGWGAFKEGHGDGFQHYAIIFPQLGLGILLLSNSDNGEKIFDRVLRLAQANPYTPVEWEGYP